ncbi:MAG: tetratricopeptide repeat protein [Elusimicrobia bacterium]|nr:tetratricopeptide repeat protein [Elusimicrobiota bacterium]
MSNGSTPVARYFFSATGIRAEFTDSVRGQVPIREEDGKDSGATTPKRGTDVKSISAFLLGALLLAPWGAVAQGARPAGQPAQVKQQLERGYSLIRANKKSEAVQAFSTVLKSDPENHAALIELGYLQAGFKRWPSAVKYLKAASVQDPKNMRLHMDLGYAYQATKDFESAAKEFEDAASEPGEFQAQAQSALKTVKDAQANVRAAAAEKQQKTLESAYAALRSGDKQAARQRFQAAFKADAKNALAAKELGFLDLEAGSLKAASEHFEAARAAEPTDYFVALQLGYVYQRLGERAKAGEAFSVAMTSPDEKIHAAAAAAFNTSASPEAPAGTASQSNR